FPSVAYPGAGESPAYLNNNRNADWVKNPAWLGGRNFSFKKDDRFYQASIKISYDFSDNIRFTSISSYADYSHDFYQDGDGSSHHRFIMHHIGDIDTFNQEIRLSGNTESINWIVGANYTDAKSSDPTEYLHTESSLNFLD